MYRRLIFPIISAMEHLYGQISTKVPTHDIDQRLALFVKLFYIGICNKNTLLVYIETIEIKTNKIKLIEQKLFCHV